MVKILLVQVRTSALANEQEFKKIVGEIFQDVKEVVETMDKE
jgi:hypothetical protein